MMNKIYNPKIFEQTLYEQWERAGYFKPNYNTNNKYNYCIILPPPNVTGSLHLGHALQQTMMDILIRYQRMQGKNVLWQPGIDHAGIATQMIVEHKISAEEGKTRCDYNRNIFTNKIWQWANKSRNIITNQMRRLGNSIDWSRERFTMDPEISHAVQEVFINLYEKHLIYKGKRLVNWDPKLQTAISDLEIENREHKGFIWYLRYQLADNIKTHDHLNHIVVATTRPETILGDTAIAVNPTDQRYKHLIGKHVTLPIVNRQIPIIADECINMHKGTGCVKITPAHDFNDYLIGKRHKLPMLNILTLDGKIRKKIEKFDNNNDTTNNNSPIYIPAIFHGLDVFSARKSIIEEINKLKLLENVQTHNMIIPHGDRSGVIIEPMLTNQWYIKISPLAKIAIQAVEIGLIKFIPKQYKNMYFSWMNNIQDWCISRQLWWGHRIPAWYDDNDQVYVGRNEQEIREKYKLNCAIKLHKDDDVLDTWFSSSLWTFTTLGWPMNTTALSIFHPTDIIVSGFDIIFFWIARMIMLTMHFIQDKNGKAQVPFKKIYITGLIRDETGNKMSKSKGNIIDPIDIIDGISKMDLIKKRTSNMMLPKLTEKIKRYTEKQFPYGIKAHGADALRFTLTALTSSGRDINWDMKRLTGYHNFCNKLWHASRFVILNTEHQDCGFNERKKILSLADKWIITKLNQTIKIFRDALDNYRFDQAANILYEFIWHQFCDWYIELTKSIIKTGNKTELQGTRYTLIYLLETLLRLAHPIIPFITEIIWQNIRCIINAKGSTIMLESFPTFNPSLIDHNATIDFEWIKQTITELRKIRIKMNINPNKLIKILIRNASYLVKRRVQENYSILLCLAKISSINFLSKDDIQPKSISIVIHNSEFLIPITDLFDKQFELNRLTKELEYIDNQINYITSKLQNINFISHAPKSLIIQEQNKLETYQNKKIIIIKHKKLLTHYD